MNPNQVEQNNQVNQIQQEQVVQEQVLTQQTIATNQSSNVPLKKVKKNNKMLIIIILAIVLIGAGYFLLNGGKFKGNKVLTGGTGNGEKIEVETGILGQECEGLLKQFFKELRKLEKNGEIGMHLIFKIFMLS